MNTQIVYALIASPEDLFLQEIWASVYSLRLYDNIREVRVCCDNATAAYVKKYAGFIKLITEIVIIPIADNYNAKQRSREIKTSIRKFISGKYLFVDTDTIFAGTLDIIDILACDIAAVPEFHLPLKGFFYRDHIINTVKNIFDVDVSDAERWHNSGVMYVADTPVAHQLYEKWNSNWRYSSFEKGNSQDQPSLIKADKDMGYIIQELPGEYNCQMAISIRYFFEAKIIHFLHFDLLPQPQNPFIDKSIYAKIKNDGGISNETGEIISHCKSSFATSSAIIDGVALDFLLSNPGHVFYAIAKHGGWLLSAMNKVAALFSFIMKRKNIKLW